MDKHKECNPESNWDSQGGDKGGPNHDQQGKTNHKNKPSKFITIKSIVLKFLMRFASVRMMAIANWEYFVTFCPSEVFDASKVSQVQITTFIATVISVNRAKK